MKQEHILKKPILIKESLFLKSIKLAKSNPNKIGLMLLFDVLFIIAAFSLNSILQYFAQSIAITQPLWSIITFIVISLVYYLLMLLVYSFFKYLVLDYIKSLFEKSSFSFNRLGQFYGLNVVLAAIFFASILLFDYAIRYIQIQYWPWVFVSIAVPYLILFYVMVNTSHTLFYSGSSIKDSLRNGLKITFMKLKAYRETILVMIIAALILWLLFFGAGYLIRLVASKNYSLYLSAYAYNKQATIIVFDVVLYFVILINRITFYGIMKENDIYER